MRLTVRFPTGNAHFLALGSLPAGDKKGRHGFMATHAVTPGARAPGTSFTTRKRVRKTFGTIRD